MFETQRLYAITCKVFKTLNNLIPNFTKEIINRYPNLIPKRKRFYVSRKTAKFRYTIFSSHGTQIWISLLENIKFTKMPYKFKEGFHEKNGQVFHANTVSVVKVTATHNINVIKNILT